MKAYKFFQQIFFNVKFLFIVIEYLSQLYSMYLYKNLH